MKNSKHETRNSKQIRNTKFECQKQNGFGFWRFGFRYCFGFRYSNFGFIGILVFLSFIFPLHLNATESQTTRFFYSGNGKISLVSAHTGRSFSGTYRNDDGTYRTDAIDKINRVFGVDESLTKEPIALRLIEFLDYLQDKFNGKTLTIASGYRSPEYNTMLRENGALAAKASLHQYGMAIDFSMAGVSSKKIWEYVRELSFGGTGFYHGKNVHIDVGPARWWDERTSGVDTDIADDNKLIMLTTDRDIYKTGETINLSFARMTAWPIGVKPKFILEQANGKSTKKIIPSPLPVLSNVEGAGEGQGEGCHLYTNLPPMLNLSWQIPTDIKPGRYKIHSKFCKKQWDAMPDEITTNEFVVIKDT